MLNVPSAVTYRSLSEEGDDDEDDDDDEEEEEEEEEEEDKEDSVRRRPARNPLFFLSFPYVCPEPVLVK